MRILLTLFLTFFSGLLMADDFQGVWEIDKTSACQLRHINIDGVPWSVDYCTFRFRVNSLGACTNANVTYSSHGGSLVKQYSCSLYEGNLTIFRNEKYRNSYSNILSGYLIGVYSTKNGPVLKLRRGTNARDWLFHKVDY